MIKKSYSTIEFSKVKALLGMSSNTDQEVASILSKKDISFNGTFVVTPENSIDRRPFEINQERIENISKIVQFLEQQKHEFN